MHAKAKFSDLFEGSERTQKKKRRGDPHGTSPPFKRKEFRSPSPGRGRDPVASAGTGSLLKNKRPRKKGKGLQGISKKNSKGLALGDHTWGTLSCELREEGCARNVRRRRRKACPESTPRKVCRGFSRDAETKNMGRASVVSRNLMSLGGVKEKSELRGKADPGKSH